MGSMLRNAIVGSVLVGALVLASGCASLSLFSHVHHHQMGEQEKERLERLQKRVSELEKAQATK